jgi:hypothetical protein
MTSSQTFLQNGIFPCVDDVDVYEFVVSGAAGGATSGTCLGGNGAVIDVSYTIANTKSFNIFVGGMGGSAGGGGGGGGGLSQVLSCSDLNGLVNGEVNIIAGGGGGAGGNGKNSGGNAGQGGGGNYGGNPGNSNNIGGGGSSETDGGAGGSYNANGQGGDGNQGSNSSVRPCGGGGGGSAGSYGNTGIGGTGHGGGGSGSRGFNGGGQGAGDQGSAGGGGGGAGYGGGQGGGYYFSLDASLYGDGGGGGGSVAIGNYTQYSISTTSRENGSVVVSWVPASISYPQLAYSYSSGNPLAQPIPATYGKQFDTIISTPPLPSGLTFDPSGNIIGTPNSVVVNQPYVITIGYSDTNNTYNSPPINIEVIPNPIISYPAGPYNYQVNVPIIDIMPSFSGLGPNFVPDNIISGSLPDGLYFNSNGNIQGTPLSITPQTPYSPIFAYNGKTYNSTTISIVVAAPTIVCSPPITSTLVFTVGTAITPIQLIVTPPGGNVVVTPALPNGLTVDDTGLISGTPMTPQGSVQYQFNYSVTNSLYPNGVNALVPVSLTIQVNNNSLAVNNPPHHCDMINYSINCNTVNIYNKC